MNLRRVLADPRVRAFIGSNIVTLGAGTPYLYSYYAPQLIERCNIPISTTSGLSLSLNIGSSLFGFIAGMIVDKNPRVACLIGSIGTFIAYTILGYCYEYRISNFFLLSLSLSLLGFCSVCGLYSAVTCCTINFPKYRGTAGAFPVSLYALSGLVFSNLCPFFFGTDIRNTFRFLSIVCSVMLLIGALTIVVLKTPNSMEIPEYELSSQAEAMTPELNSQIFAEPKEPSTPILQPSISKFSSPRESLLSPKSAANPLVIHTLDHRQFSTFDSTVPINSYQDSIDHTFTDQQNEKRTVNSVIVALKDYRFYIHFFILATLQGIGQMYIYSVGYIVQANTEKIDIGGTSAKLEKMQSLQVSILSLMSFSGRLVSGPISDILVKRYRCQRLWNIIFCSLLTLFASWMILSNSSTHRETDTSTLNTSNYSTISYCSMLFGLGFGIMFGSFPSIIAEAFGSEGFSTIWGLSTSGGIVTVKFFASLLGNELSHKADSLTGICQEGSPCYTDTFTTVRYSTVLVLVFTLALMFNIHNKSKKNTYN
ncbi:hypothetical protein TPHA_0C03760 [Tetrapisispora phaffii CBS 4417]|uniref:Uncharacterized protein n=1 Tax=Tetrapisispora phaffii (strain ATCC 24235 / CBS 4417 / NBRC 1672 / NRRL Y-8282 / UCD 70-5) TaxID=1071381 RepID=G8BQL6_TETPH|nr:hypothetical protein TPHA_0C03760 [Tetrapisispora phaffii CBS 4417]CCE62528.1 hypothetical protein TPHA_0C03760 [Tetrapisispora phaffii CBS 4417]